MTDLLAKTVIFTLGGVVVGGLHSVLTRFSKGEEDQPQSFKLCVTYSFLQRDPLLLSTLAELDVDFQSIDPVAGIRVIRAIDDLVGLRTCVDTQGYDPMVSDRVKGVILFRKAKESVQRFITRAETTRQPRQVVYIQRHVQTIMRQLETHLQAVVMATRDIYIHP
jgi:hypothetical protein